MTGTPGQRRTPAQPAARRPADDRPVVVMTGDREPVALGVLADGQPVLCDPDAPDVRIIAAGDAYDAELLRALRDEIDRHDPADAARPHGLPSTPTDNPRRTS